MNVIHGIINSYAQFLTWDTLKDAILSPQGWISIIILALMECMLSSDNAIALAVRVMHLPEGQRAKALKVGIWGAYAFRVICIGLGMYIIHFWWLKALGGAYLIYMAIKWKIDNSKEDTDEDGDGISDKYERGFWNSFVGTIIAVEGLDIALSSDSILAGFGISSNVWIVFIGALLGIAAMRFISTLVIKLVEKVPELEGTAYAIICGFGVKLVVESFGVEIPEWWLFCFILGCFLSTWRQHVRHAKEA